MTDKYIPASKLLALQRWDKYKNLDPRGEFINFADLRAVIEQHKHEAVASVWNKGFPPHPYDKEWFIAKTKHGDRVVLKALPEEYSYDFKTADETYMKKEIIVGWMQFPDTEFKPFQQPDIIAELVKALEDDAHAASFQSMAGYRKWLLDLAKGAGK